MFWDDWNDIDWKIYSTFVAVGGLLIWNLVLTILVFVLRCSIRKNERSDNRDNNRWEQANVPSIPRLKTAFENRTAGGDRFGEKRNRLEDYNYY